MATYRTQNKAIQPGFVSRAMKNTGTLTRYALAVIAAIVALYLRQALMPLLGDRNLFHTAWLAVVFSAWYCGLGPSIVATVLSALGIWYWFIPPVHSFNIHDPSQMFGLLGFLLFSAAIIALGESNRRGFAARSTLAAIVDSSDDAIVSKNLNGIITSWNGGAERIFGYSAQEAVGRSIMLIIPADLQDQERQILARLRKGERIEHFETVRVNKNGDRRHLSLTISPLRDSRGVIIGASKVARDITEKKQAEEIRKETEFAARLLKLQDEERRRIARELHDGVGQLLAAMSMNASMLDREKSSLSPDAARSAEENAKLIEQVSSDIRTLSYLFHPPLLDEIGLHSALRWYLDGFAERSKFEAELELSPDWVRLPQDYELCLFRIAQECLTNIHRHSGGSMARVRLLRSPGEITMEVSDDGKGVDRATQNRISSGDTSGVGFRGMRERVKQLGGSLEVRSHGKGTTVIATVPFVESADGNGDGNSGGDGNASGKRPNGSAERKTEFRREAS
ncbi:MAG: PAS domain S-box protein [Candidatus Acidiferrales bacterium]